MTFVVCNYSTLGRPRAIDFSAFGKYCSHLFSYFHTENLIGLRVWGRITVDMSHPRHACYMIVVWVHFIAQPLISWIRVLVFFSPHSLTVHGLFHLHLPSASLAVVPFGLYSNTFGTVRIIFSNVSILCEHYQNLYVHRSQDNFTVRLTFPELYNSWTFLF